jgi:uncharacterized protein YndB with AHSA1/START domain
MMRAMQVRHELRYDAPVDEVYAMLGDADFRRRVCEAMDVADHDISVQPHDDGGMAVRIDMLQRTAGLPGFATRIVGDRTRVIQSETWVPDGDGHAADLDLAIPGKPGHIAGRITLRPAGKGSVERFEGDVVIRLPLVGGRVERLVQDLFIEGMDTEQRLGVLWLSGDRT